MKKQHHLLIILFLLPALSSTANTLSSHPIFTELDTIPSTDCAECKLKLTELRREYRKIYTDLRALEVVFDDTVDSLENIINELRRKIEDGSLAGEPAPAPVRMEDRKRYEDMREEAERAERDLLKVTSQLDALRLENTKLREELDRLRDQLAEAQTNLAACQDTLNTTQESLAFYQGKVDSIAAAEAEERRRRLRALGRLDEVNRAFQKYWNLKGGSNRLPDTTARRIVHDAWEVYTHVDTNYLRGQEYFNMYRIVKGNLEGILDSLGTEDYEKINGRNQQILSNLGKAIELGPDSITTLAVGEVAELPANIIAERNIDSEQVASTIEGIKKSYDDEDYASALSTFSNYQNVFDIEEYRTGKIKEDIDKACLAAGTIMLWNLGNVTKFKNVFPKGGWARKSLENRTTREIAGKQILEQLIKDPNTENEVKKEAAIMLGKYYSN